MRAMRLWTAFYVIDERGRRYAALRCGRLSRAHQTRVPLQRLRSYRGTQASWDAERVQSSGSIWMLFANPMRLFLVFMTHSRNILTSNLGEPFVL